MVDGQIVEALAWGAREIELGDLAQRRMVCCRLGATTPEVRPHTAPDSRHENNDQGIPRRVARLKLMPDMHHGLSGGDGSQWPQKRLGHAAARITSPAYRRSPSRRTP